ncbi:MAG: parallel beta-helix domain-containing protein [Myxococcota bacterium]
MRGSVLILSIPMAVACGNAAFPTNTCKDVDTTNCVEVDLEDATVDLQEVVNSMTGDTTVLLGVGTFTLDNQITFRGSDNVALIGQGMDETLLDFGGLAVQANGVDAISEGFLIQDLTIQDAPKDGLRVEDSNDVTIRRVRATWSRGPSPENGGYGLYPVRSNRVLIENSEAFNSSDAGIYVGQCIEAVVRDNLASGNVAGLEIENTQYADVYGNVVEDNTGGLVVFDLPGNPVVGRDVYIHDNIIRNNNRDNFAPGGTVAQIPAGTGTFAMASRRIEISNNTYENNNSVDIALISGLVVEGDPAKWVIPKADVVGNIEGLELDADEDNVFNFRTTEAYVHSNSHSGSGTRPDNRDVNARPLGFLFALTWSGDNVVDSVVYDAIGETSFSATDASGNSNDHHICVGSESGATFASLDLENLSNRADAGQIPNVNDLFRPPAPFAPFDCGDFTEGPLVIPTFAD